MKTDIFSHVMEVNGLLQLFSSNTREKHLLLCWRNTKGEKTIYILANCPFNIID